MNATTTQTVLFHFSECRYDHDVSLMSLSAKMGKKNKKRRRLNNPDRKISSDEAGKGSSNEANSTSMTAGDPACGFMTSESSNSSKQKDSSGSDGRKRKRSGKAKKAEDTAPKASSLSSIHDDNCNKNTVSSHCAAAAATDPSAGSQGADVTVEASNFPYPTDADDHCETPQEAYEHIVFFLQAVACSCGHCSSSSSLLKIYDPYYCDGAVKRNFATLGFPNVYNEKQDCYAVWKDPSSSLSSSVDLPEFDVLVTNPPYSGDHIQRLVEFVTSKRFGNRPWCLLLPNWVHKKDYYIRAITQSSNNNNSRNPPPCQPFYLVPRKRYVYLPPKGFRQAKKSDVHKKASPFVSMWYIWGGTPEKTEALIQQYYQHTNKNAGSEAAYDLARTKNALRDMRRKKRKNT